MAGKSGSVPKTQMIGAARTPFVSKHCGCLLLLVSLDGNAIRIHEKCVDFAGI
jgi:hypothetical protein